MGFVYRARQPALDRTVALKILAPELSRDPAFAERFAREARVLGKLSHPNIVTVFEHGVTQPSTLNAQPFFYLLMEFVDGVNLRQAIRAGRFTPQQALAIVPGICDALQAAHAQGVWHRDIKPENILLDARGGVKIADFGIARIVGDPGRDFTLTAPGAALGSAAYMAPEQHENPHDVDHRADIYSLGVVIYEMLTGELPLGRFPAPSQRAAVSARIDEIVFRTLEKERELRQQSAAEVKTDVSRAAAAPETGRRTAAAPAWTLGTISKIAILSGFVLFIASVIFTGGSTQGALLALATTLIAMGLLGVLVENRTSVRQFCVDRRPGKTLAGAMLFAAAGIMVIYMIRGPRFLQLDANARQAAAGEVQKAWRPPPISVEEAFRKMHNWAAESNGVEFMKRTEKLARNPANGNKTAAAIMAPFMGRILRLEVASPPLPNPNFMRLFAVMEKPDGTRDFQFFYFSTRDGEWIFREAKRAPYRAVCRIEFRPQRGDAETILRAHLPRNAIWESVAGEPAQYRIFSEAPDADEAVAATVRLADNLGQSLESAGLGAAFRVVKAAEKPVEPWKAE